MSEQDDLARWADDDLVRALRAPGTAAELAEEDKYVDSFRAARGSTSTVRPLPRRTIGRLGAGGTAVVITVALTSGMAAAYTGRLPDPVQQIAHSVIGAPAPAAGSSHSDAGPGRPGHGLAPAAPGSTATSGPSDGTSTPPASASSPGSTDRPDGGPSTSTSSGPSTAPSGEPSSGPTTVPPATAGTPGGMTAAGMTHRAAVGEAVTLSATLTTTDGVPLPDYPVVLQVRGPRRWHAVTRTTTDASGAASTVTPPVTRTARYRWHTDHHVHSPRWLVSMVPTVTASAAVSGASTLVSATSLGGRPGDSVQLLRWADHQASVLRLGNLDVDVSVSFQVDTTGRRAVYVVRLAPTQLHAGARARVVVIAPAVASVALSAPAHRVVVGGSLTMSGTVRAADGSGLAGRVVHLQVRGPHRWFGVGSATTDATGSVAIATPAASRTVRYRLRAGNGRHSAPWRVAMVPTMSATTRPDGSGTDVVATVQGGRAGDRVVLLRRRAGRLVAVQHAPLAADGSVSFAVTPRKRSRTYVVRLVATRRHAVASAKATVDGTG